MIGPTKATSTSKAMVLRKAVYEFFRGRHATSFLSSPYGMVIAPSDAISNTREARQLVQNLELQGVKKNRVYQVDNDSLSLKVVGKERKGLVFSVARAEEIDAQAFVLPESIRPNYFRKVGSSPREYFYDPIEIGRDTADLLKHIEVEDKGSSDFIQKIIKAEKLPGGTAYLLIYHNYRDEETNDIRLKADAIVCIKELKKGTMQDKTSHIRVHRLPGTVLERLPLEILLEDYPAQALVSRDDIKISKKQYEGIYKATAANENTPSPVLGREEWISAIKPKNLVELKKPSLTLKEKWAVYKKALVDDPIFALACVGSLLQSIGQGLMEGFLLPAILIMGQDVLKVISVAAFMTKFSQAFHLWGNSKGASQVEQLEAKERAWGELSKQFPLWNIGVRHKSTQDLISKYTTGSLQYLLAGGLFFLLTPPIFAPLTAAIGGLAAAVFVALYASHEYIHSRTDGLVFNNLLKIIENRIRLNPKYKKNYWTVRAFHENLEIASNQIALGVGVGAATLLRFTAPAALGTASIVVGIVSLGLFACRLLLRAFGKDERTRLDIGRTDFLRYGKSLKFSENIRVELGDDVKVPIIEEEEKGRVVIPDFEKHGIKLKVSNFKSISVKRNWPGRILPFNFAKRRSIIVRTTNPSDPPVIFKLYGKTELTPQQIEERFIEKVSKGSTDQ